MKYGYQCYLCGLEFVLERRVEDRNEPAVCPECRKPTGARVFYPVQIITKPYTGEYTRGELARLIEPSTDEEREVWKKYG